MTRPLEAMRAARSITATGPVTTPNLVEAIRSVIAEGPETAMKSLDALPHHLR